LVWQALMKRSLFQVRVIPQTHKMINQLWAVTFFMKDSLRQLVILWSYRVKT
jgi:hypothetical protein